MQGAIITVLALASAVMAKDCNTNNPFASECVAVYGGTGCQSYNLKTAYTPTCAGNCYVYPFDSITITASEFYNVDCHAYSDKNCQNQIGDTGNVNGGCYNFEGGQSMKCYYHC